MSETVEVEATPNEVVAETSVLGRTVTEREISELMVSGRNPLLAVQFKAGVVGGSLSTYMGDGFGGGFCGERAFEFVGGDENIHGRFFMGG